MMSRVGCHRYGTIFGRAKYPSGTSWCLKSWNRKQALSSPGIIPQKRGIGHVRYFSRLLRFDEACIKVYCTLFV